MSVILCAALRTGPVVISTSSFSLPGMYALRYRYITTKDNLCPLLVNAALGPPTHTTAGDWRARLTAWAVEYRTRLLEHPWIVQVIATIPPITPNQVAWLESLLQAPHDTTLLESKKLSTLLLLSGYIRSETALVFDRASSAEQHPPTAATPTYGQLLRQLCPPAQFPAINTALAAGIFDQDDDASVELDFGLQRILDGIAMLIAERASA